MAGRFSWPPTLIAVVPVWVRMEFWMLIAVVNMGIVPPVPPVVVTLEVTSGAVEDDVSAGAAVVAEATSPIGGGARMKADVAPFVPKLLFLT